MAKKKPVGPLGVTAAIPRQPVKPTAMPQSAQAALDASKKQLDDGFAEAMASRLGESMPCNAGGRPAYVFSAQPVENLEPPKVDMPAPGAVPSATPEPARLPSLNGAGTVLDSLVRLLELSLTTANTVLSGGAKAMDWFYDSPHSENEGHCGGDHEHGHRQRDCESEAHSPGHCGCEECVPGVGSCC